MHKSLASCWITVLFIVLAIGLTVSKGSLGAESKHPPDRDPSAACGSFTYHRLAIGPLDYRIAPPDAIEIVETRHFTRNVEMLTRGERGTIGGDIAYTLNAFPNHPRALRSAAAYERRRGPEAVKEMGFSTRCWFERAVSFRAADPNVRIIIASELIKRREKEEARSHLVVAEKNANGSAVVFYNLGLLYFDLGDYDRSMAFAREAYGLGLNLPGLRQKLTSVDKWQE